MMSLTGRTATNPVGYGEAKLFPMMDENEPSKVIREHFPQFNQFNETGSLAAELESTAKVLPRFKRGTRVAPAEMEQRVRRIGERHQAAMPPHVSPLFEAIRETVIRGVQAAGGDL